MFIKLSYSSLMSKKDKSYSVNEVGTLVEALCNDISIIAENVKTLRVDVTGIKQDVEQLKTDTTTVKDALRIVIPSHHERIPRLEAKVGIAS